MVRSANVMLPSRVIRSIAALLFSALMQTAHKYAQDTFGTLMRCVFIFYRTVNLELRGNISAVGRYQDRNSIIFHIHYIIPFPCSSTVPIHFYVAKADLFALCEIFLLSPKVSHVSFERYHDADPLARGAVLSDPEAHRARNFPAFERDELALVAELDIAMFAGKRLAYYLLYPVVGEVGGDVLSVKRAYMIRIVAQQLAFFGQSKRYSLGGGICAL